MSLTKLLKAPIKLFKKEVITFVTIRRYDLGIIKQSLRYIAVKPNASISALRHKIWHLLDLPDYCEELIILKSANDVEIPLTELRKGNDPHRPYILEVWLSGKQSTSSTVLQNNMLMDKDGRTTNIPTDSPEKLGGPEKCACICGSQTTLSNETIALNKVRMPANNIYADLKKSELSCRISTSSIFRLNGRKSRDNFTNLLLKIRVRYSSKKVLNLKILKMQIIRAYCPVIVPQVLNLCL